jgi:hypothetical protein
MAMNPKMRAAMFEHLSKQGRMNPMAPRVPTPHPKMIAPIAPPMPPNQPNPSNQVNPNYVGNPKLQRFKRLKTMFGL